METGKLLEAIIRNAIDGIITIDNKGIVESINPAAMALFGYSDNSEIIGNNISMLMPEPDRSRHDSYIHNYLTTGVKHIIGIGREVRGKRRDGTTFPFRLAVSEVNYKDRKIFTGFIHDLSKQKEAEEKLKEYTAELEMKVTERTKDLIKLIGELEEAKADVSLSLEKEKDLNQMKSRFVSMASHEFRTPLSSVQLSASLIEKYLDKHDFDNITKHTNKIKGSVQLLTNILNDFLSLERLEAGKVTAVEEEVNLIRLAEDIIEEMQLLAKQNQHIVYQHTGEIGKFRIDPNLLKNSILNLISNAIKYSGENTFIEFNSEINGDSCIITIKDNGIGIPFDEQKNLFEPFFRANNTGNIPGTGLGLNIVKRYVHLMKGEVMCKSEVNKGTTFTLIFKN
ncbi:MULTISPECIES: PAS domain-containing sensor histidine kinase [Olivibacter]|uniref:histidine kinase n=2 Tax=Olivibacter TaxID=376469 RepID=A0ABV6HKS2_9SPHI|nr:MULTISPECIES: PAS domain-containing sensor histidine kinase [Olivibacter]MDM8175321.1 PAS domain-containing sensor histidine kinase [Olivibacter sp. 47]QEL02084.1 PAS domain S-box protein [Olivibacter sp. LS-1]